MIPYASRTVDIILHPDCPIPKKGVKDVLNLLKARELSSIVEAVVQISIERYRITFNHTKQMQAFCNQDFFIHGKPVEFKSVSPYTWVYISNIPARLRIAGHWCVIKYRGQKPVCFNATKKGMFR